MAYITACLSVILFATCIICYIDLEQESITVALFVFLFIFCSFTTFVLLAVAHTAQAHFHVRMLAMTTRSRDTAADVANALG